MKEKIGFLGVGNMGAAIARALLEKRLVRPSQIYVCDKIEEKARKFAVEHKVERVPYSASLAAVAEVVVLAVKPQDLNELNLGLAEEKEFILISILAGTPLAKIREHVSKKARLVRAMPNLAVTVGEAITALTGEDPRALKLAETLFAACGRTVLLENESWLDCVTAVSGSGPAYFFLMMELLMKEALAGGLSEKVARELAIQTAVGAGLLARHSEFSPEELRKQVTSKGGTTEAALRVFENEGLPSIVSKGIKAALERARELSGG